MCDYLRQARQTTLGESGVEKLAECNLEVGQMHCKIFMYCLKLLVSEQTPVQGNNSEDI